MRPTPASRWCVRRFEIAFRQLFIGHQDPRRLAGLTDLLDGIFNGGLHFRVLRIAAVAHIHPEVQAAIEDAIQQIRQAGKAPGILMANEQLAKRYLELGALFVAVGVDTTLLARGAEALAARFTHTATTTTDNNKSIYCYRLWWLRCG